MKNARLFNALMKMVKDTKGKFFFHDSPTPMGTKTRVFSYHCAGYSDWEMTPHSLEARGILFEIDDNDKPVRVMSRPMRKFWNYGETPYTMNLDLSKAMYFMSKEDGSLISTYYDQGCLFLKSKTRLASEHAGLATACLNDHPVLKNRLTELAKNGFTVNMEYTGPDNQIVLEYQDSSLTVLSVRNNDTGEEIPIEELFGDAALRPYLVDAFEFDPVCSEDWINKVSHMVGIEGFIVVMEDGQRFKIKTDWYFALHKVRDSLDSNHSLIQCCANRATDDLRSLYRNDPDAIKKINAFESLYFEKLGTGLTRIQEYVKHNKHLDKRSYAIKAQVEFKDDIYLFHSAMRFHGQQFDGEQVIEYIKEIAFKRPEFFVPKGYE